MIKPVNPNVYYRAYCAHYGQNGADERELVGAPESGCRAITASRSNVVAAMSVSLPARCLTVQELIEQLVRELQPVRQDMSMVI